MGTYSNGNGSGAIRARANATILGFIWFGLILFGLIALYLFKRVYIDHKYFEYGYAKANGESKNKDAKLGNRQQIETERQLAEAFTKAAGSMADKAIGGLKGKATLARANLEAKKA